MNIPKIHFRATKPVMRLVPAGEAGALIASCQLRQYHQSPARSYLFDFDSIDFGDRETTPQKIGTSDIKRVLKKLELMVPKKKPTKDHTRINGKKYVLAETPDDARGISNTLIVSYGYKANGSPLKLTVLKALEQAKALVLGKCSITPGYGKWTDANGQSYIEPNLQITTTGLNRAMTLLLAKKLQALFEQKSVLWMDEKGRATLVK